MAKSWPHLHFRMSNSQQADHDTDGHVGIVEQKKTKKPRRYQVVFHNDDYTTMEFVIHVLIRFFRKTESEATHVMLHVHHQGYGVAQVSSRDVAESKVTQVMDYAKEHGHPLRVTAEPEGFDE